MASVIVYGTGKQFFCNEGDNLLNVLLCAGVYVNNPCNGSGTCGKCKVRIRAGEIAAAAETEKKLLRTEELTSGIRLSCMVEVHGDIEVELLQKGA